LSGDLKAVMTEESQQLPVMSRRQGENSCTVSGG